MLKNDKKWKKYLNKTERRKKCQGRKKKIVKEELKKMSKKKFKKSKKTKFLKKITVKTHFG